MIPARRGRQRFELGLVFDSARAQCGLAKAGGEWRWLKAAGVGAPSQAGGDQHVAGGGGQMCDLGGIVPVTAPVIAVLGDQLGDRGTQRLVAHDRAPRGRGERVAQQQRDLLGRRVGRKRHVGEPPALDDQRAALGPPLDLVTGRVRDGGLDPRALAEEVAALVIGEVVEEQDRILDQAPREPLEPRAARFSPSGVGAYRADSSISCASDAASRAAAGSRISSASRRRSTVNSASSSRCSPRA